MLWRQHLPSANKMRLRYIHCRTMFKETPYIRTVASLCEKGVFPSPPPPNREYRRYLNLGFVGDCTSGKRAWPRPIYRVFRRSGDSFLTVSKHLIGSWSWLYVCIGWSREEGGHQVHNTLTSKREMQIENGWAMRRGELVRRALVCNVDAVLYRLDLIIRRGFSLPRRPFFFFSHFFPGFFTPFFHPYFPALPHGGLTLNWYYTSTKD